MANYPSDRTIESWRAQIEKNGSKTIGARQLLRHFGFQRRGRTAIADIKIWLAERRIYTYGFEVDDRDIDAAVTLDVHAMTQIGRLVAEEKELLPRFATEIMPKLGLFDAQPDYKPSGSRDRFDFLCRDARKNAVVVELKRRDGEKRAVEQLMRYIGLLRAEGHATPRGVLVTGYADPHTRRALAGRQKDTHIEWYVYGLVGELILVQPVV